ncbi:unnamed protein product [Adineta ricciae]|uniref:Uncharacterized protein n=1 Tax=Adineta ricciae TaxID=249248 RepID=A0A813S3W8_ADIRI|nr:unnamed protein product [Adineta ricciae]CAF1228457.1 unnamed protein product [Adineta ricciae]
MKVLLVCSLLIVLLGCSNAAFQCYKCNNCGTSWDPSKATLVLTEGGTNYCVKRVSGTTVTKDYSATCSQSNGVYCCQDELCNSAISNSSMNFAMIVLFSIIGFVFKY